jgi:hypothetical protein
MGARDLLRELDSRLLPPLARRMSRLAHGPARLRLLTGVALLSSTAVLVTAVWTVAATPTGEGPRPDLLRVGVIEGQSVPGYVRSSRGELAALLSSPAPGEAPIETYALITLTAYFAPDRLAPLLGGTTVAEVYARAPLTGIPTQVVRIPAYRMPDDVLAGMLDAARRRDREQADYAQLAAAAGDADQRLRRAYDNAAQVAAAEAIAYRSGCSCVFAAVVQATPAALERLAHRVEVRAVDPAPEVERLDRVEFSPPLPEQESTVTESSPAVAPLVPGPAATAKPTRTASAPASAPSPPVTAAPGTSTSPVPLVPTSEVPQAPTSPVPLGPQSEPSVAVPLERTAVPSGLPVDPSATTPS